jgi:hypothetical protein
VRKKIVDILKNLQFILAKNFLPITIMTKYFLAYRKIIIYEFDDFNIFLPKVNIQMTIRQACKDDMEKLVEMRTSDRSCGEDFVRRRRYLTTV